MQKHILSKGSSGQNTKGKEEKKVKPSTKNLKISLAKVPTSAFCVILACFSTSRPSASSLNTVISLSATAQSFDAIVDNAAPILIVAFN